MYLAFQVIENNSNKIMSRNVSLLKSAMNLILKKDIRRRSKLNGYGISDTWFSRNALPPVIIINIIG